MPLNPGRIDPRTLPQIFAWYSADAINGFFAAQPAADAAVAQWNDLSGNGRHLVQGTGANQPLFRLTGGPNNGPSVQFVDTTDTMAVSNAAVQTRPVTVIAVVKNTVADDAALHRAVTFNAARIGVGLDWATANAYCGVDDAAAQAGGTVAGDITNFHVLSFVAQPVGGFSIGGADGVHVLTAGQAGTNTDSGVAISPVGATMLGHYCEAIVLTGELNRAILFALEQSLAERWGIFTSYALQK